MSWITDFADSFTYGTSTGNISGGMVTYYDRKFLRGIVEELRLAPLGQKRDLPKGNGKTIQFFRYNDISVSASSAYLTEGINPNATNITGQNISATLAEYGGFSQHSSLIKSTHLDRNLAGVAGLWGNHAAALIDLLTHMEVCACGAYPMRADGNNTGDGTYSFEGTVDSATTTGIIDTDMSANTNFGDANDDANQSIIVIRTGTGKGQARPVTDYVTATGAITVSPAWDVTPAAGDTYHVLSAHGLTTGTDILTTTNIRAAVTRLRNNKAAPYGGGFYVGIISPDTEAGLMADTNWTNVMQYRDRPDVKVNGLFANEVGEWGGVRFVRTTQPFRFPITTVGTAGTAYGVGAFVPGTSYTNYAATGAVYANLILGREAFGVTRLSGAGNVLKPGIIIKNPGSGDTSNPLNRFSTVGWTLPFVPKALNPLFAVQLWSTPTAY